MKISTRRVLSRTGAALLAAGLTLSSLSAAGAEDGPIESASGVQRADLAPAEGLDLAEVEIAPPPPGTPAPLAISEPGRVEALLEAAHLTISGGGEVSCPFIFRDIDHAWTAHSSAGPLQKVIDAV